VTQRTDRHVERSAYGLLWNVVSGAVADAFNRHPDYLTSKGKRSAATSIIKRVTGTVLGFAVEQTARSRRKSAETGEGTLTLSTPKADGVAWRHPLHSYAHVNEVGYQAVRRALFPVGARAVRKDAKRFQRALAATTDRLRNELGMSRLSRASMQGGR
jgi:hypothetical protein